jgi:hypothetical protein
MQNQKNTQFGRIFFLKFTKELIRNSVSEDLEGLKKIIKESEFIIEPKTSLTPKFKPQYKKIPKEEFSFQKQKISTKEILSMNIPPSAQRILKIPESKLPLQLQYLKPIPSEKEINLGKLNKLIKDPLIKTIECNGPDEKIIITTPARKLTEITLSKEEIIEIIEKFSQATKIPIEEGIIKIAFGKLVISAIISEVVGSKFIIKKLFYNPNFYQGMSPQNQFNNSMNYK